MNRSNSTTATPAVEQSECCEALVVEECNSYLEMTGKPPQRVLLGVRAFNMLLGTIKFASAMVADWHKPRKLFMFVASGQVEVIEDESLGINDVIPCRDPEKLNIPPVCYGNGDVSDLDVECQSCKFKSTCK